MNDHRFAETSVTGTERQTSASDKGIRWILRALGFLAVAYFAWYRLPVALLQWANDRWWHWGPALFAYFWLFAAPIFAAVGPETLTTGDGASARFLFWSEIIAYLAALIVAVLILWAFLPAPELWGTLHWWLWGAAVVCSAALSTGASMFRTVHEVDAPKARKTFAREWRFNHGDINSPPALGIAMSGGGIRSAAFNLGVLHALHEKGILREVDVISAVSGGSYTLSWYLLQPFYAAKAASQKHEDFNLDDVKDEMFRPDGKYQAYLCEEPRVVEWPEMTFGAAWDATIGQLGRLSAAGLSTPGLYNGSGSIRRDYLERLQKLFQGMPSPDSAFRITNEIDSTESRELIGDHSLFSYVTPVGYRELAEFAEQNHLPFFIFNASVLVERTKRHMLWPTAFELTADDIGSDVCGYRSWGDMKEWEVSEHLGKGMSLWRWKDHLRNSKTEERRQHRWVLMANLAPAISGAAIGLSYFDPKKRSRAMKLRTWTPFFGNLDLGYLFPREIWNGKGTLYLSDGGHSDNLGAYALIKRGCRRVIVVDAEYEAAIPYVFNGYSKLKERLKLEMRLILTVSTIDSYLESAKGATRPTGPTEAVMTGEVKPLELGSDAKPISVIYVKLGLDRNCLDSYPLNVSEYALTNKDFPQDSTSHQSYKSKQFAAYRDLGRYIAANIDEIMKTGE